MTAMERLQEFVMDFMIKGLFIYLAFSYAKMQREHILIWAFILRADPSFPQQTVR